jgi:desampylase
VQLDFSIFHESSTMAAASVTLTDTVRAKIAAALTAAYPDEGCGALIGRRSPGGFVIEDAEALPNIAKDRAGDRYEIDPLMLAALERRLAGSDRAVIGFFHSHPGGVARPSSIDLETARGVFEFARTFYLYAIMAVEQGAAGELTCWQLNEGRDGFVQIALA